MTIIRLSTNYRPTISTRQQSKPLTAGHEIADVLVQAPFQLAARSLLVNIATSGTTIHINVGGAITLTRVSCATTLSTVLCFIVPNPLIRKNRPPIDHILHGFHLVNDLSSISSADCTNYLSAENPVIKPALNRLFQAELRSHRIQAVPYKPLRVNAIGSVQKKDTGEPGPITNMSRPFNNSVNDHISCGSYHYKSIDDAIALMRPGCFFATVDIKSAYRWVSVYPPHHTLQGFRWAFNGSYQFFTDNFLCCGLKNAPSIFHGKSCAVTRMMTRKGFPNLVNYLDDFLIVSSSREECLGAQLALIRLLHSVGFQVNWSKLHSPSQRVKFLGIILDSLAMQAFVPEDKISSLEEQLHVLLSKRKASKRDLQRVAGLMNFLAKVVKGGRTFLRRVLDSMNRLKRPFCKSRLTFDFARTSVGG